MSIKDRTLARGLPDWHNVRKLAYSVALQDMAELAARLESAVTYDRRGEVIGLERFESPLSVRHGISVPSGGALTLSYLNTWTGDASLRILTPSANTDPVTINVHYPFVALGKFGVEHRTTFSTGDFTWLTSLILDDGSQRQECRLRYDSTDGKLYYLNSGGTYTLLDTLSTIQADTQTFHPIKLVGDFEKGLYDRVMFDTQTYNLSSIQLRATAVSGGAKLWWQLSLARNSGVAVAHYVDDLIVTQNEL